VRARGSTLIELLAACFCLGVVGLLVVQLIVPSILAALRILNQEGDLDSRALAMIRQDVASSVGAGVSFAHRPEGWWLAIVPLENPGSEGQRIWSGELIVYRYRGPQHQITRQILSGLKWPDGEARLTGSQPAPFSEDELLGLPQEGQQVVASAVRGEEWSQLVQPWTVTFGPETAEGGKLSGGTGGEVAGGDGAGGEAAGGHTEGGQAGGERVFSLCVGDLL